MKEYGVDDKANEVYVIAGTSSCYDTNGTTVRLPTSNDGYFATTGFDNLVCDNTQDPSQSAGTTTGDIDPVVGACGTSQLLVGTSFCDYPTRTDISESDENEQTGFTTVDVDGVDSSLILASTNEAEIHEYITVSGKYAMIGEYAKQIGKNEEERTAVERGLRTRYVRFILHDIIGAVDMNTVADRRELVKFWNPTQKTYQVGSFADFTNGTSESSKARTLCDTDVPDMSCYCTGGECLGNIPLSYSRGCFSETFSYCSDTPTSDTTANPSGSCAQFTTQSACEVTHYQYGTYAVAESSTSSVNGCQWNTPSAAPSGDFVYKEKKGGPIIGAAGVCSFVYEYQGLPTSFDTPWYDDYGANGVMLTSIDLGNDQKGVLVGLCGKSNSQIYFWKKLCYCWVIFIYFIVNVVVCILVWFH